MASMNFIRRSPLVAVALVTTLVSGCRVGPNYGRPQVPTPRRAPLRRGRGAGGVDRGRPWWERDQGPASSRPSIREAIANNLDLRTATARVAEARAQYGIARSFLFPQVGVAAGYDARSRSRGFPSPRRASPRGKTYQNYSAGYPDLLGDRPVRPASGGRRRRPSPRTSRPRRAVAPRSSPSWPTSASTYLFLRELDLQLEVARRTVQTNEETVAFYEKRLEGGVSNRLEVDRAIGQPRPHGRGHPAARAADRGRRERPVPAPRPAAGADRARRGAHRRARGAGGPGRAARRSARAAPRRARRRAGAGRGERQHRRGQVPVLPDDLPHRPPRHDQRRLLEPAEGRRRTSGR